jgi:hypothetical protein
MTTRQSTTRPADTTTHPATLTVPATVNGDGAASAHIAPQLRALAVPIDCVELRVAQVHDGGALVLHRNLERVEGLPDVGDRDVSGGPTSLASSTPRGSGRGRRPRGRSRPVDAAFMYSEGHARLGPSGRSGPIGSATPARLLVSNGMPLEEVSRYLGHSLDRCHPPLCPPDPRRTRAPGSRGPRAGGARHVNLSRHAG